MHKRAIHAFAHINNRRNPNARFGQCKHIVPAAVMRSHQHDSLANCHAVTIGETSGGRRQHHAGRIIAIENQRSFDRTLRKDNFTCPNTPQFLTRDIAQFREVIGQPLHCANEIVVIIAEGRRAGQYCHIGRIDQRLMATL